MKWNSLHKGTEGLSSVWGDGFLSCTGCLCLGQRDDKGLAMKWCKWGTFLPEQLVWNQRWPALCLCKWREELCQTVQSVPITQIFLLKVRLWGFLLTPQCFPWGGRHQANHWRFFSADLFNRGVHLAKCPGLWAYGQERWPHCPDAVQGVPLVPHPALRWFGKGWRCCKKTKKTKKTHISFVPAKSSQRKAKTVFGANFQVSISFFNPVPRYLGGDFQPPYPNSLPVHPQTC